MGLMLEIWDFKNSVSEATPVGKNPDPEDQDLFIPSGDLLCWNFIDIL